MLSNPFNWGLFALACIPFIYYALALFSAIRFFSSSRPETGGFLPPISNLKPVRGLDPDAYENFASFCRQDYPAYEVVFCVGDESDPVVPVLRKLQADFPHVAIRVLFGSGRQATNDKVAKLARLVAEAKYEYLVISDSDARVEPNYLRTVIAPLEDAGTGAVTCFYVSTGENSFLDELQSAGMISDFYPGLLVARQLDGVKFALGPTIATTRTRLSSFGGYESLENKPADDLWVGRLIADDGYRVELLNYSISTVADYRSWPELWHKRMRWLVVMRHMRPWGHLGLALTQGLPWTIFAVFVRPTAATAACMFGLYWILRLAMLWCIGVWGLRQRLSAKSALVVIAWDAVAFVLWLASFTRSTVRWRGGTYRIRDGMLVPAAD